MGRLRSDGGQSTVEFALVLPLVVLLMLGLLQAGLLLRDQLVVSGAAREGAREAAVSADIGRITRAAERAGAGLDLTVIVERGSAQGSSAEVIVSAKPLRVPMVGAIVSGMQVKSKAVMRVERQGR